MRNFRRSIVALNAECNNVCGLVNRGIIALYTGVQPLTPEHAVDASHTLIAILKFSEKAFAPASGGQALANPITPDDHARAAGTVEWFRAVSELGDPVFDGSVGSMNVSEVDCALDDVDIRVGARVAINWMTYIATNT